MSSSALQSNYKGASIDGDGDFLCRCGFRMYKSTVSDGKSPYFGKKYLACRRGRKSADRCRLFIWDEELPQIKLPLSSSSEPATPKRTSDIRQYGILTPVTSSRKVHPAVDRASGGNKPSQITFSAQAKKRSLFSTPGQVPKKPRIVCTPSRSPSPTPSKSLVNGSPASGLNDTFLSSRPETMHFMRGGSRRWEDYEKDLSMTPTKHKSHVRDFDQKGGKTEAEEGKDEDLLSDWDDTIVSEVIRIANSPI
ncbi:uncharacterized protein BO88DRAFT_447329 [Aspergillus vadensis CBS 113365]|uniref:GRF-type domain-containing protein n=1 Tax=Aspergillus vadensis (strain CBS 113365 / IMI 142717 / IBT 24658) TaxID=1448311 RepID=A0A319C5C5_ASPVC|nr:hypothetical protein BO88DRAFT_447329 [Aspergillus vadensis CBS 113365]PYH63982.1 hypothetical protein BO88DRAFT_447329 [Aspergillus vadensis CBS 113365]